ncbi:MAG: hypothetical protein HQ581_18635 [Planctomycetes bacterium]|nr:hypothetical protein [Planctomycetota bacterium]
MDFRVDQPTAVLSKSLSSIKKTSLRLRQLDRWQFPTSSSELGRDLLLDALAKVSEPTHLGALDPVVLYKSLFSLRELAGIIERSSTDRISWPLVRYCDEIWGNFFGQNGPKIFYALTPEYNYSILHFSKRLADVLRDILPNSAVRTLVNNRELYCLQLASSEDENLPLYANIGHEFGHTVFGHHRKELVSALDAKVGQLLVRVLSDLQAIDAAQTSRRFGRICQAVLKIGEELFCDLLGALLMGPAFFLSLFEFSWGQARDVWTIGLSPEFHFIRAYPSFGFRLHCISQWARIAEFRSEASSEAARLITTKVAELAVGVGTIPVNHSSDVLRVWPASDDDAEPIRRVLNPRLNVLKTALGEYLDECDRLLRNWYPIIPFSGVGVHEVAELLLRLENDLPPNIVPDNTLLGKPATFGGILNASALFRLELLTGGGSEDVGDRLRQTGIVERLTAKAFESTFIQREFNKWAGEEKNGRSQQS